MVNETPFERLVIAAYRLPFKLTKTKSYKAVQNSGGLVSAILALSENFKTNNKVLKNSKIVWAALTIIYPIMYRLSALKMKGTISSGCYYADIKRSVLRWFL